MGATLIDVLFCLLLIVIPVAENRFWEDTDYSQWSQQQCEKLLTDSPWAKAYKKYPGLGPADYVVQFRSAKPIREAMVRQMQITANYDELPPVQRQEFNKQSDEYLSQHFKDVIIVSVKYWGTPDSVDYWMNQTAELLKNKVFLITGSGEIPLSKYIESQESMHQIYNEFQFIFPRRYRGHSILSAQDQFIKLEFHSPRGLVSVEFKVNEMIINGNVQY